LLAYIRSSGADKVGAVGFCWGAKAITVAAAHGADMDAIALVHPRWVGLRAGTCERRGCG
jgi:dienelactone hydrolase